MSALRAALDGVEAQAGGAPQSLFYPLEPGNHWGYDHSFSIYIIPTGGPPGPAFGQNDRVLRDLVCIEHRLSSTYTVEQVQYEGAPPWWVRYRQDGSGLFEADVDVTIPPSCAAAGRRVFDARTAQARPGEGAWAAVAATIGSPSREMAYRAAWERIQTRASALRRVLGNERSILGPQAGGGVGPNEITRLEYPLHPGAHWVIREDPRFESTVEGAETLDLAVGSLPGWRIRVGSDVFGAHDSVHLWYGRSGYLRLVAHLEGIATDEQGNPIGVVVADESEVLTELSLNGGRFAAP
jgi:hypothetical protein